MVVANGETECFLAGNSLSRGSRLLGLRPPQSGRFDFGSETRKTVSGVRALIAGRGSNLLSASIAGKDELNDDGFDRLAATHLADRRNESGIRRSRFVLSPKHAPPRSPGSFLHVDQMTAETARSHQGNNSLVETAFLGSG